MKSYNSKQKGFSIVESLLVAVIVISIGGVSWYVLTSTESAKNTYNNAQSNSNQALSAQASTAKQNEASAKKVDQSTSTTPTTTQTTTQTNTKSTTPSTTPKSTSQVTHPTKANCTGATFTAYISNPDGVTAPYNLANPSGGGQTFSYKSKVNVYCDSGTGGSYGDYGLVNDSYVKLSDLRLNPL